MTDLQDMTFKSSRIKWGLFLCLFSAFVAGGVLILKSGEDTLLAWATICFFGLGVPISLWQLANPGVLRLSKTGFEQNIMGRILSCHWDEVSDFSTYTVASNSFVCFSRRQDEGKALSGINQSLTGGYTGQLGDSFGIKAEKLAKIMNDYRERALKRQALKSQTPNLSYRQQLMNKLTERNHADD